MDALPRLYSVVAALLLCLGMGRSVGADPPASGASSDPPQPQGRASLPGEVIILNDADDIGEFWKKLNRPDLIMVKPGSDGTAAGKETAQLQTSPRSQFISSVKIRGRIENDLADLQIELEVGLLSQGPQWVPIGLDNQIITSAREGDRELQLKSVGQGRWEVRVEGQGTHALQLGLRSPVEANPDRKRLQFAIPLGAFDVPGCRDPETRGRGTTGERRIDWQDAAARGQGDSGQRLPHAEVQAPPRVEGGGGLRDTAGPHPRGPRGDRD